MQTPKVNISIGMRQLNGICTQNGNRRTMHVGSDQRNLLIPQYKLTTHFLKAQARSDTARRTISCLVTLGHITHSRHQRSILSIC
jgi:hypothetical protein